jgi:hypothetical protein
MVGFFFACYLRRSAAAEVDNVWPNTIIDYQVVTMAKHYQVLLPAQIILKCAQQIG